MLLQAEENRVFIWDHIWLLCPLHTTVQCHQGQNHPGTPDGFLTWVTIACNTHALQILLKNNAAFKQIAEMQDYSCLNTNSADEIEAGVLKEEII